MSSALAEKPEELKGGDAVIIWGEVLWDRFPDGDQLGGAPANVAWHLGQSGAWARLVTRVGDDLDGRRAVAKLEDHVDVSLVQIDRERATGEVTVRLENNEPKYTLHADRAWERIACTDDVKTALAEAGVLIYGTLAQRRPEGLVGWRDAIANAKHCLKVCDLNLRPTDQNAPAIKEALDAADVLKVNDRELAALRDWFGWADPIAKLHESARVVAVTHGAAGSTVYGSGSDPIKVAAFEPKSRGDNVGCGDAYLAILVRGLTLGWDLAASARAASRWAAAVAGVRGATPEFTDEQIDQMLECV